jgi:predicted nucleic acid-binding protein
VIILDTNVVSELMRPEPNIRVADWIAVRPIESLYMTAVTTAEILFGIARLPAGRKRAELAGKFQAFRERGFRGRLLPFDDAAADRYAEVMSARRRGGRRMAEFDAMIAAIAIVCGADIATRDIGGFQDCGVRIHNPWD